MNVLNIQAGEIKLVKIVLKDIMPVLRELTQ